MSSISLISGYSPLAAQLGRKSAVLETSTAQLSSGERITRASDDIANLSIATRMTTRLSGLRSGQRNIAQAQSALQIADNALSGIDTALQRMNALAVQASSGHLTKPERAFLNIEYQTLKAGIDYTLESTRYGDRQLFRGELAETERVAEISSRTADNPFDPTSIGDLAIWLDANDTATIIDGSGNNASLGSFSGSVAQWLDKSGNGNNVSQANAAERPTYAIGAISGQNAVRFDGSNDRLPSTVPLASNQLTTFVIANRTGGGGTREFFYEFGSNGEASRDIVGLNGTTPVYYNLPGGGTQSWNFSTTVTYGNFNLYSTVTNDDYVEGYVDGSQYLATLMGSHDRNPSNAFVIGDDSTSGDELHGNIVEMLAFDSALTDAQRQDIEGYLAHKYGLQANLTPTHDHATTAPVSGTSRLASTTNIGFGQIVAQIQLTGGPYNFAITGGNDSGAFAIDTATGDIILANPNALAPEDTIINLTVSADDGANATIIDVEITIDARTVSSTDSRFDYLLGDDTANRFSFDIGEVYLTDIFDNVDNAIASVDDAVAAVDDMKNAIDTITRLRAYVGSKQAQAGYITDALESTVTASTQARAMLQDTDIAVASTEFALAQAGMQATISISVQSDSLHRSTVLGIVEEAIQLDTLA